MSEDDSLLSNLTSLIPGYGSYKKNESRREDDRLTREFLVKRIRDCKSRLDQLSRKAVEAGNLEAPLKIEKQRDSLDHAERRLASAVEGYSGWFSRRDVDAEVLTKVANHDANLVSLVDQIDSICQQLAESSELNLNELTEANDRLQSRIDRRAELLQANS